MKGTRNPSLRRQEIIKAALTIFARRGFHGTNMADIASQADVAVGSIYRQFKSKEVLGNVVYQHCHAKYQTYLAGKWEPTVSAQQQFFALWQSMVSFSTECPDEFTFFELWPHTDYLDEESLVLRLRHKAATSNLIKSWQDRGELINKPHESIRALIIGSFARLVREQREFGRLLAPRDVHALAELCWSAIKR